MRTMLQRQRGGGLLLSPNYSGLIGPEEAPGGLRAKFRPKERFGTMQRKVAK